LTRQMRPLGKPFKWRDYPRMSTLKFLL